MGGFRCHVDGVKLHPSDSLLEASQLAHYPASPHLRHCLQTPNSVRHRPLTQCSSSPHSSLWPVFPRAPSVPPTPSRTAIPAAASSSRSRTRRSRTPPTAECKHVPVPNVGSRDDADSDWIVIAQELRRPGHCVGEEPDVLERRPLRHPRRPYYQAQRKRARKELGSLAEQQAVYDTCLCVRPESYFFFPALHLSASSSTGFLTSSLGLVRPADSMSVICHRAAREYLRPKTACTRTEF